MIPKASFVNQKFGEFHLRIRASYMSVFLPRWKLLNYPSVILPENLTSIIMSGVAFPV